MDKKMSSISDAAQKELWKNKITEQQKYRKQILGLEEQEPETPSYTIDDKPVDRKEFLETAEANPDGHNYVVTGDEEAQQVIRNIGGIDDKNNEPVAKATPTDEELVNAIQAKNVPGYSKTSIDELKEQALQAPDSFKNQFGDDEATTINLIAKNTTDQINKAIEYQQERLKDPDIDEKDIEAIGDAIISIFQKIERSDCEFFSLERDEIDILKHINFDVFGKEKYKIKIFEKKRKIGKKIGEGKYSYIETYGKNKVVKWFKNKDYRIPPNSLL
jgi:hypothetical protein